MRRSRASYAACGAGVDAVGGGVVEVVPRARIDAMTASGLSLMPEGLESNVGPQAMADLIAFLRGLRAAAPPR